MGEVIRVGSCRVCGELFDARRYREAAHCPRHRWARRDDVLIDRDTPYRDDVACQLFVSAFPDGATLEAISEALGVSRERVRQIERDAFRKLRALGFTAFGLPEAPFTSRRRARHDDHDEDPHEEGDEPSDGTGADDASSDFDI